MLGGTDPLAFQYKVSAKEAANYQSKLDKFKRKRLVNLVTNIDIGSQEHSVGSNSRVQW